MKCFKQKPFKIKKRLDENPLQKMDSKNVMFIEKLDYFPGTLCRNSRVRLLFLLTNLYKLVNNSEHVVLR